MKSGKTTTSVPCHYQDKFKLPVLPSKLGTGRLDESWVDKKSNDLRVRVTGILSKDDKYFFALENCVLPETDDFPIGGGFYPTYLSNISHTHRTRWTYNHFNMKPIVPPNSQLVIGTFILGKNATMFLDGRKIILDI